jgi:hypothetical protein
MTEDDEEVWRRHCRQEWRESPDSVALVKISGLHMDLVSVVVDYRFALNHLWVRIGRRTERQHCTAVVSPMEFRSCVCFQKLYQHTCSLFTVNEGPKCWRIQKPYEARCWVGLLANTTPTNATPTNATPNTETNCHIDSLLDAQVDFVAAGAHGQISGYENVEIAQAGWGNTDAIEIYCDVVRNIVYFLANGKLVSVGPISFDLGLAKPFVQLEKGPPVLTTIHHLTAYSSTPPSHSTVVAYAYPKPPVSV